MATSRQSRQKDNLMRTIREDREHLMTVAVSDLLSVLMEEELSIAISTEVNELPINIVSINEHKVILLGTQVEVIGALTYMNDSETALVRVLDLLVESLDMTIDICQSLKEEGMTPENSGEDIVVSTLKLFNLTMDEAIDLGFE